MFDALVNGRIDTGGMEFNVRFADIEELNRNTVSGRPAITKISCAVLPLIADRYRVLNSGAALGYGNGPLLVSRGGADLGDKGLKVAVPGFHTTAEALMRRIFPHLQNRHEMLFSEIAGRVAAGEFDAGVLIHEGRFTYENHGLHLEADLGKEWDRMTGLPLPLGCIATSKELPDDIVRKFDDLLGNSIEYAFAHPEASGNFVKGHAQEMSPDVTERHIRMFVNDFSLNLGRKGREAIKCLTGLGDNIFV